MIAKISGKIQFIKNSYVVVDVGGIGYKVFVTNYTLGKIAGMKEVEFYVYTYVREDTLALYGFLKNEELEMFELLISISGIGPKAALGILTVADPKTIRVAILNEDAAILTKVSGVGKKTAERVIMELKNKVIDLPENEKEKTVSDNNVIEALLSMGYSINEARNALKLVPQEIKNIEQKLKLALKNLGKK